MSEKSVVSSESVSKSRALSLLTLCPPAWEEKTFKNLSLFLKYNFAMQYLMKLSFFSCVSYVLYLQGPH